MGAGDKISLFRGSIMAKSSTTIRCTTQWSPLLVTMDSYWGGICTIRCENLWFLSLESPEELLRFSKELQSFAEQVLAEKPKPKPSISWVEPVEVEDDESADHPTEEMGISPVNLPCRV